MSLPFTIRVGRCEDILLEYPDNHFHSCVTDPPYGLKFMGSRWDYQVPSADQWKQAYRVLRPGAYLLAFGGPRTYHRLTSNIEDAGFEIRDQIFWVFSSGFPKSLNLDGEFDGWGTALKPAHEPILVARKPLDGTVYQNMTKWGTGAINIKKSLVQGAEPWLYGNQPKLNGARYQPGQITPAERFAENVSGGHDGRWPANVIHDGSEEVLKLFPVTKSGIPGVRQQDHQTNSMSGRLAKTGKQEKGYGDEGSAGRFFKECRFDEEDIEFIERFYYCPKVSREDRNEGCKKFASKPLLWSSGIKNPGSFQSEGTDKSSPNNHPTVKPTNLMRYLVNLVTPEGGKIVDMFAGSGSTGKGAIYEHFDITLIDEDPQWEPIQKARCMYALNNRSNQTSIF